VRVVIQVLHVSPELTDAVPANEDEAIVPVPLQTKPLSGLSSCIAML
jgi:hypothetical protein